MARPSKKQLAEAAKAADAPKVIDVEHFIRVRDSVSFFLLLFFLLHKSTRLPLHIAFYDASIRLQRDTFDALVIYILSLNP